MKKTNCKVLYLLIIFCVAAILPYKKICAFNNVQVMSVNNDVKTIKQKNKSVYIENSKYKYYTYTTLYAYNENGDLVWKYKSKKQATTELDSFSKPKVKEDFVLLREGSKLVALDYNTGKTKWTAKGCGAGEVYADDQGNIFVPGFYGPDLTCFDISGKIKWTIKQYSDSLCRPYHLKMKGSYIYLYYEDCYDYPNVRGVTETVEKTKVGNEEYNNVSYFLKIDMEGNIIK